MNERIQPGETARSTSLIKALVAAIILQLFTLAFTGCLLDGGVLCGIYARVIAGYWVAIGFVRVVRLARGRSLLRIIAITGWIAPVACLIWIFVPMFASAAHFR